MQAVDELIRILKPGGRGLIYVWALEQERNKEKSKYLKRSMNSDGINKYDANNSSCEPTGSSCETTGEEAFASLPVHVNRTQFKEQDLLVPWRLKNKSTELGKTNSNENVSGSSSTYLRYYHVFVEGELEELVEASHYSKIVTIVESYYDQGNWCVVFEKLSR